MTETPLYRRRMFEVDEERDTVVKWECANCEFSVRATATDLQCGFRFECPECGGNVTGRPEDIEERMKRRARDAAARRVQDGEDR
jgi:hypothetical protein